MTRKKTGRIILAIGLILLLVALVLVFYKPSPWALLMLVISILMNTVGISAMIWK